MNSELSKPILWNIILTHDSDTKEEFVIFCLKKIFKKTQEEAKGLSKKLELNKLLIIESQIRDIADTKRELIIDLCRKENKHINIKIEKK